MKIRPQKTTAAGQADEVGGRDAIDITTVHVNQVLQQIRAGGLIVTKGTRLTIPDRERLKEVGQFNPGYLQLEQRDLAAPDEAQGRPSQHRAQ